MMIFIYLTVAFLSFTAGFLLAGNTETEIKIPDEEVNFAATEDLRREYENFLNYDGSEQM